MALTAPRPPASLFNTGSPSSPSSPPTLPTLSRTTSKPPPAREVPPAPVYRSMVDFRSPVPAAKNDSAASGDSMARISSDSTQELQGLTLNPERPIKEYSRHDSAMTGSKDLAPPGDEATVTRPTPLARRHSAHVGASISEQLPKLSLLPPTPPLNSPHAHSPAAPATPNGTTRPGLRQKMSSLLKRTNSRGHTADSHSPSTPTTGPSASQSSRVPHGATFSYSSQSSRSATSRSVTPPSPHSPNSTIQEHVEDDKTAATENSSISHDHSRSSSTLQKPPGPGSPRPGITWGPNYTDGATTEKNSLERSNSQDHLGFFGRLNPSVKRDPDAVELMATFSYKTAAGTGLKARRLSTVLPDEFHVETVELEKEYKTSSFVPGRRGKTIGNGATATVKLMLKKHNSNNVAYAVKEFRKREKGEDELEYVKKVKSEYTIAKSLHHPNIVHTVQLCTSKGRWNHVMEYCQFGEIFDIVQRGFFREKFTTADRLCLFKQLLRGVDYLHSHGIAHRDIKLENLLLSSEGYLKISDFGVSEVFCGEHPGLRTAHGQCGQNMGSIRRCAPGICGSLPYIAPEVLEKNGDYDPRGLDVWGCAIVYLTMTYGGGPWSAARPSDKNYARFKGGWDNWLAKHPDGLINDTAGGAPMCGPLFAPEKLGGPALKRVLLKMLHPNPDERISVHEVLQTGFVKGIECCSPESYEDEDYAVDASTGKCFFHGKSSSKLPVSKAVLRKHTHLPGKPHKTPDIFKHRFDMGDGY